MNTKTLLCFSCLLLSLSMNGATYEIESVKLSSKQQLSDHIRSLLGPHIAKSEAYKDIRRAVDRKDTVAFYIFANIDEIESIGLPVASIGIASTPIDERNQNDKSLNISAKYWEYNIISNRALLEVSTTRELSVSGDVHGLLFAGTGDSVGMLSPNNIATMIFVAVDGDQFSVVWTNGYMEDYAESSPIARNKVYASLYETLDKLIPSYEYVERIAIQALKDSKMDCPQNP